MHFFSLLHRKVQVNASARPKGKYELKELALYKLPVTGDVHFSECRKYFFFCNAPVEQLKKEEEFIVKKFSFKVQACNNYSTLLLIAVTFFLDLNL